MEAHEGGARGRPASSLVLGVLGRGHREGASVRSGNAPFGSASVSFGPGAPSIQAQAARTGAPGAAAAVRSPGRKDSVHGNGDWGWRDPTPLEQMGGGWLVGKRVRVFWEDDDSWNSAVVLKFDPKPAKDSHGNVGPIHTLKYEDGEFDEVFDDATKFQIAMPRASMQMERTESDLSTADTHASLGRGRARGAVGAGASGGSAGGGSRAKNGDTPRRRDSASKRVKTEVFSHRVQTPAAYDYAPQHALPLPQTESDGMGYLGSYNSRDQDLDNGHVDEGADCKRPRERKLSARMREAAKFSKVLDLTDDSEDDFRCELQRMREGRMRLKRDRKGRKRTRHDFFGSPANGTLVQRRAPQFAGVPVPATFLDDSVDPLFMGCTVEVLVSPGHWTRARFMERTGENGEWVRVVTDDGKAELGTFRFYPFTKDKENAWILGCGEDVRIPMSVEEWKDMGPGRHVRVTFDDGMNYLGVVAYQTVCKHWHVFFQDDEEIEIKVPAEDAIPVPEDCSEWVSCHDHDWWGHRYAARLRSGADAAVRTLKEMKRIVEDRLDRSTTLAFRARLPTRAPGAPVRRDPSTADSRNGRVEDKGAGVHGGGASRQPHAAAGKEDATTGKEETAPGKEETAHPQVKTGESSLPPHLIARLASLREREDKSRVRWDRLHRAIQSRGGLSEVDAKQSWGDVMRQMRVDPSKIEADSSAILRTWYIEKKKSRKMDSKMKGVFRTNSKRSRNESDDSWEPEKASRRSSLPSSQPFDRAGADSGLEQESEEEVPLRPRKLTERLYEQHNKHLKELFAPSLLGSTPSEPRWKACALMGNPCIDVCNCPWTSFATGVGALALQPETRMGAAAAGNAPGTDEPPRCHAVSNAHAGASPVDAAHARDSAFLPGPAPSRPTHAPGAGESDTAGCLARDAAEASAQAQQDEASGSSDRCKDSAPSEGAADVAASLPQIGFVCLSSVAGKGIKSPSQQAQVPLEGRNLNGPNTLSKQAAGVVILPSMTRPAADEEKQQRRVDAERLQDQVAALEAEAEASQRQTMAYSDEEEAEDGGSSSVLHSRGRKDHAAAKSDHMCGVCHSMSLHANKRCAQCKEAERQRGRSASVLARWWRRVWSAGTEAATAAAGSAASAAGAGVSDAADSVAAEAEALRALQVDLKTLDTCPHCSCTFSNWIYQQRAALATKHMRKCCPYLLPARASPRPYSQKGKQTGHRLSQPLELEREAKPVTAAESDELDARFTDAFAAYRCCGRTFLRTHDLERHWARAHTSGVVACARGYADPCNFRRQTNNRLGLGVKLVARTGAPAEASRQGGPDKEADKWWGHAVGTGAQQGRGKGKSGNFWMLGHRSLSYAATAMAHTCCDSDDSLDIVLR